MKLYIDESGSMTCKNSDRNPYFVISMVKVKDIKKVVRYFKRFVSENYAELQTIDKRQKMFTLDGRFRELKGSELTPELKKKFMSKLFRDNALEVFFITIDNKSVNSSLYNNTARAFNYCVKLAIGYYIKRGELSKDIKTIEIDERNESTKTRYFLEEYLNTELILHENVLSNNLSVRYFDSAHNIFIQIADVFANIKYSDLLTGNYKSELEKAQKDKYIKKNFNFPQKKAKKNIDK